MAPMPPSDKIPDKFLRPCLNKVNITVKDPSQEKLNTEDNMAHNLPVVRKIILEH